MSAMIEEYWAAGGYPFHSRTGIEDLDALEQGFAMPLYLPGQEPKASSAGVARAVPWVVSDAPGAGGGSGYIAPSATAVSVTPAAARPDAPDIVRNLVGSLGQAASQAFLGQPASSPLGAVMGAGMSPILGTGPLPGALGRAVETAFGSAALPALSDVRSGLAIASPVTPGAGLAMATPVGQSEAAWGNLAGHSERIGRAIVRRVLGVTNPQLREILDRLATAATQVQATAEHRSIISDADFKRNATAMLARIAARTGAIGGGSGGAWARF